MRVTCSWLRLDLPGRARPLAVLALLVAVSAGTVLAAVAGARRADSALSRLQERSLAATAWVLSGDTPIDWTAVRALPSVEALETLTMSGLSLEGVPEQDEVFYLPAGTDLLRTVESPVVLRGRLSDPSRVDEAVVTSGFVDFFGKDIGDVLVPLRDDPDLSQSASPPVRRPWLPGRIRIVGVVRSPLLSDDANSHGQVVLTPALMSGFQRNERAPYIGALVRLRDASSALTQFRTDLARVSSATDVDVQPLAAETAQRRRVVTFEARFLLAFGAAAAAASLVLVGQAVTRYTAAGAARLRAVRALGLTRRQAMRAAAAAPTLAALAGTVAGAGIAVVASRWFPVGSASAYEPDPGVLPDWLVLGAGVVTVPTVVLAGSLAAAWLAWEATRADDPGRRSLVADRLTRLGAPVPVVVGARMALEGGRGSTAVPPRPALVGAVVGILGTVAALTFSAGISEAAGNARRFGQVFPLAALLGEQGQRSARADRLLHTIAADPDVAAVIESRIAVATAVTADRVPLTLYSLASVDRPAGIVVVQGRMAASPSEVVLGSESAAALRAAIGSRVVLDGGRGPSPMTVTGIGFLPESWQNGHASGGWVTATGFDALVDTFNAALAFVELRAGADPTTVRNRLNHSVVVREDRALSLEQGPPPHRIGELKRARGLPLALSAFLAVLAVGSVGHALAAAVRRRRRDLAVLRAVGMTRRQARALVVTQAEILAATGLVFGVPPGLAVGRQLWRLVAEATPVQYVQPAAAGTLLLLVPVTLLTGALLAAWPARRAARLRLALVLRAE